MPRATSAAKLGPDRIAGTALGAHSAITSVMNFSVPRSMPLAQTITGVRGRDQWRQRFGHRAHRLRRHYQKDRRRPRRIGGVGGDRDAVVDPDAGQEPAFAALRQLRGGRWSPAPTA